MFGMMMPYTSLVILHFLQNHCSVVSRNVTKRFEKGKEGSSCHVLDTYLLLLYNTDVVMFPALKGQT